MCYNSPSMKKIVLFLLLTIIVGTVQAADLTPKQAQFIKFMEPKIHQANSDIKSVRKHLIYLHFLWEENSYLKSSQEHWLQDLALKYKVGNDVNNEQTWNKLLKRVDILPDSLILAQAINESAWGQSYFAKQGNNYFGQWCTDPGCGIVPRRRPKGRTYEVKVYTTPQASVNSYILNLNTNRSYRYLRDLRWQMRENREVVSGIALAEGLHHYSQLGKVYVERLQAIIEKYGFSRLDRA